MLTKQNKTKNRLNPLNVPSALHTPSGCLLENCEIPAA